MGLNDYVGAGVHVAAAAGVEHHLLKESEAVSARAGDVHLVWRKCTYDEIVLQTMGTKL